MRKRHASVAMLEAIVEVADMIYYEIGIAEDRITAYREEELESSEIWRIETILELEARVEALKKVADTILKSR